MCGLHKKLGKFCRNFLQKVDVYYVAFSVISHVNCVSYANLFVTGPHMPVLVLYESHQYVMHQILIFAMRELQILEIDHNKENENTMNSPTEDHA